MKIGTQHRNQIWRNLVEFRNKSTVESGAGLLPSQLQPMDSQASTISNVSQISGGYNPGFYEVTRYTFKHTVSIKKEDHDYC